MVEKKYAFIAFGLDKESWRFALTFGFLENCRIERFARIHWSIIMASSVYSERDTMWVRLPEDVLAYICSFLTSTEIGCCRYVRLIHLFCFALLVIVICICICNVYDMSECRATCRTWYDTLMKHDEVVMKTLLLRHTLLDCGEHLDPMTPHVHVDRHLW